MSLIKHDVYQFRSQIKTKARVIKWNQLHLNHFTVHDADTIVCIAYDSWDTEVIKFH